MPQDLDVDFRLQLKDELYKKLMRQIKADAALLERMRVMDYSLLLGIHYTEEPNATEHSKVCLHLSTGDCSCNLMPLSISLHNCDFSCPSQYCYSFPKIRLSISSNC